MGKAGWIAVLAAGALALPAAGQVKKAVGAIELADAAGDCAPIHGSSGDYAPYDIVKLALASDGKALTVTATLAAPPSDFASSVVELFLDTDNNPATGVDLVYPKAKGFEYRAKIEGCLDSNDGGSACEGGLGKAKVVKRWSGYDLERYKGTDKSDTETIIDSMGFGGHRASPKTPLDGKVVRATIDYTDLKVKPGQTLRILAKESCGYGADDGGYFPEILLTLK